MWIGESYRSRAGTYGEDGEIRYVVRDIPIDAYERSTVYGLVAAVAPLVMDGKLYRHTPELDNRGEGLWYAKVPYKPWQPAEDGALDWKLNIGTRTMRVTHSLETISQTAPAGKTAPDYQGAINVVDGERVDGVDRVIPTFEWDETWFLPLTSVTVAWLNTLYLLTGRTNSVAWRFFSAGEVLFLGASGSPHDAELAKFTFRFQAEPNLTNIEVGDITVPAKKGHEYLWVRYAPTVDAAAKRLVRQPIAAYVERVYESGAFAAIGVPDPWA